jgi:PAS domain S-box-containing protein
MGLFVFFLLGNYQYLREKQTGITMSTRFRKGELEATRQTVKFFETLLRISADGIVITDSKHNIIVVNETFCAFFGRECRDVVETSMFNWLEQLDANALKRWSELEEKVCLEGFCRNAEFRMTTKDKVSHFNVNAFLFERFGDDEPGVIISIWQDITERKLEQEALRQKTHDSGERVKELNCLYGIANLVEQKDLSLEEILQGTINLIPPSWRYPEITCARIIIHGREWKTKNFRETIWKQANDIKVHGERCGVLEVYYLEENPEIDEGPFIKEERNLINAIAGLTGRIVERKQGEEILRASEGKYRTLLETTSEGCWLINPELKTIEVNEALCKMLRYRQDEMIGKTPFDFVDDENRKIFIEQTSKISNTLHRSYEITLKKKNGQDLPTYFNATTIRGESGEVQGSFAFITDITEKKRAEKALRKSEDQYRNIFKNIQDVYYEVTLDGIIIEASPSIEDVSLYKREEIIGQSLSDIYVDPKNRDEFLKELLKNGKVTDYEALLINKDRSQTHCSITAKLVRDKHGNPVKIIGSLRNITERKRIEESLRQSESQKRAILDASIDRIRYIDKDMKIIWANKTTAMELNMSSEDLVGHTCYELFVGRDTPCKECPTVIARETGKIERAVIYQPEVEGIEGESYWDAYCVPIKNDAGEIESFIQISRNITDQKRAEEHINILTQELMRTQESERQRISRDLHDHVAQELSAVKIGFETLFDHQPAIPPEIRRRVSEMSRTLQESIKAVRDVSYDLRPPALDEMGLVETLVQYCNDFSENNGINVDFHSAGMKKLKLDFDTEINLYRLIQEGLTNIKKHADADHVTIRLVAAFPDIILRIEDNGKGFNVQKRIASLTKEKRMGIHSMVQRAKLLQGEMEIQSKPMKGTKISIMLPYKDQKSGS